MPCDPPAMPSTKITTTTLKLVLATTLVSAVTVTTASCVFSADVPKGAHVKCTSNDDCSAFAIVCSSAIDECVPAGGAGVDADPPTLVGAAVDTPVVAPGAVV